MLGNKQQRMAAVRHKQLLDLLFYRDPWMLSLGIETPSNDWRAEMFDERLGKSKERKACLFCCRQNDVPAAVTALIKEAIERLTFSIPNISEIYAWQKWIEDLSHVYGVIQESSILTEKKLVCYFALELHCSEAIITAVMKNNIGMYVRPRDIHDHLVEHVRVVFTS